MIRLHYYLTTEIKYIITWGGWLQVAPVEVKVHQKTYSILNIEYTTVSLTCPVFFTMILSECLSATPRTYVATQYPAQDMVNSSMALFSNTSDWLLSFSQAESQKSCICSYQEILNYYVVYGCTTTIGSK